MERTSFYTTLIEQLGRRATRAVLGLCGLRNDALREYLTIGASLIHRLNSAMDSGMKPSGSGFKPCH